MRRVPARACRRAHTPLSDTARGKVIEAVGLLSGVTGTVTTSARNPVGARVFKYTSNGTYTQP